MADLGKIEARLKVDGRQFSRGMKKAEREVKTFSGEARKGAKGVETFQKALKAAAALGAAKLAADLFKLGVQAEAWGKRYTRVFGEATNILDDWVRDQNQRFGVAEDRLKGMAAGVGDLLVPMGFARKEAAGMSKEILTLANALSEWTGGTRSAEQVADVLTRALLGEREALKGLGVSLTEADIKTELARQGMTGLTGETLAQAKAQVTLELITKRSADALAEYGANADSAQVAQKKLEAAIEDLQVQAGKALLAVAPLVSKIAELIAFGGEVIDIVVNFKLPGGLGTAGGLFAKGVKGLVVGLPGIAGEAAFRGIRTFFRDAGDEIGRGRDFLAERMAAFGDDNPLGVWVQDQVAGAVSAYDVAVSRARFSNTLAESFAEGVAVGDAITKAREDAEKELEKTRQFLEAQGQELADAFGRAFGDTFKKTRSLDKAIAAAVKAAVQQQRIQDLIAEAGALLPAQYVEAIVANVEADALIPVLTQLIANPDRLLDPLIESGVKLPGVWADALTSNQQSAIDAAAEVARNAAFAANKAWLSNLDTRLPIVPGTGPRVPQDTDLQFHSGGVVPGPAGADVPAILQAGETVIPAGGRAGMSVVVNVGGSVISEGDLVEAVRRGLRSDTIRGGSLEFA